MITRARIVTLLVWILIFSFAAPANAFFSSSTSFTVPISELMSISGSATSTSFGLRSAGGQQATGISTSTSFSVWAGILYSLFGSGAPAAPITVSGTVFSDDGLTTTTSTVSISVNGGTKTTTSTDGSGAYIFTTITEPVAGDVVTVWMDNAGAGNGLGAVVTRYNSGNISALDIYKNQLIARHEDSGPLINTDIDACTKTLGAGCADSDLHFDVSGGALTVDNDWGLYLWGGDTFTPGGAVTLSNGAAPSASGGDLKWASSTSVLAMGSNSLSVGGDILNDALGDLTSGSAQVVTFTATTTGFRINPGNAVLRNVTFNGSGGGWSPTTSTMIIGSPAASSSGNLTMTAGTLDNSNGTSSITVHNGSVTGTGGIINLTSASFTMQLYSATSANFGSQSGSWTFHDLTFTVATSTAGTYTFTTETGGSGDITIGNKLDVEAGLSAGVNTTLNAGNRTWALNGTDGTPFVLTNNSGTASLDSASSTFSYAANNAGGNTTIQAATYWDLTVTNNPGETFVFSGDTAVNNGFTFTGVTDTIDTTGATFTVNGQYLHNSGVISGTGNIIAKGDITIGSTAITNLTGGTFEHRISTSTAFLVQPILNASTTFYNLTMNNTGASLATTTLTVSGANRGFIVSNDWTIGDNSSNTYSFAVGAVTPTLRSTNDLIISASGQFNASTSNVQVGRNFTSTGAFNANSSTITFITGSATSTVLGAATELAFYNFTVSTASKSIVFSTSTPSYRMNGLLTLRGTASTTPVYVESNSSGTQWNINHQGTEDVEFISLKDSGCVSTSTDITITNATSTSIDRGNNDNPCWLINDAVAGIVVSGTVFSDRGSTTATSSVNLAVGSSTAYTTSTNSSGAYIFTDVTTPASGEVLTVWMNNNGGGNGDGVAITRAPSSGDVTGLDIYKDYLITRHEDAGPLTNADMSLCDKTTGSACTDNDLHFEVTTSTNALVIDNDWGLYFWGGDTLTPGGAVTLSNGAAASTSGGDLRWASSTSSFVPNGHAVSVGGDWNNSAAGTFTVGTSTVTFTATTTAFAINSGAGSFADVVLNGAGGTWSASSSVLTITGDLTLTAGVLDNAAGSADIMVSGDVTGSAGSINLTGGTFTQRVDGGTKIFSVTTSNWKFYNLDFTNSSVSAGTIELQGIASSSILVLGDLTIGSSSDSGSTSVDAGTSTLILSGVFSSTTTSDASGNGNHGTLTAMDPEDSYVSGVIGPALSFDGTGDYVVRTLDGTSLTELGVSFWTMPDTADITLRGLFQWAHTTISGTPFILINRSSINGTRLYVDGDYRVTCNIDADTWTHFAITLDTSNLWTLYKNGSSCGTYQDDASHTYQVNAAAVYLGSGYNGYYSGSLDEVRIYNRVLTASEVSALYNKQDVSGSLLGHWPMSDGTYNDATPFQFGTSTADFISASSTVSYAGNYAGGNTTVLAESYWDLDTEHLSETFNLSGNATTTNDLNARVGTLDITTRSLDVNGNFLLGGASTFNASSTFSIAKNLTANGTFSVGSSTAIFDSVATSTLTGLSTNELTFWNFTSQTAGKPLVFATSTQGFRVNGLLTLRGASGTPVSIDSNSSGTQWNINHQGTEDIQYVTVKDSGCVSTSTYISVSYGDSIDRGNNDFCWAFPSLSLSISPLSVNLSLGDTNTFTASATNTLTVSTNSEFGYSISAYETALLTHTATSTAIINWAGTNASPTVWTTTCISSATCGFGYNTDDADLTQFTSTEYAGFTTSTPGDVVAESSTRVTSDATTMTYRASVDLSQAAGDYQTTIRYIVTPRF